MTPEKRSASERLKEIEELHKINIEISYGGKDRDTDKTWLIARVRRLEAYLEELYIPYLPFRPQKMPRFPDVIIREALENEIQNKLQKPTPREFWLSKFGLPIWFATRPFDDADHNLFGCEFIHVREVTEDEEIKPYGRNGAERT